MTFHHEFVLNVFYVRFVLVEGSTVPNPAEWHRLQVPLTCVTAVTFFTQQSPKKQDRLDRFGKRILEDYPQTLIKITKRIQKKDRQRKMSACGS